MNRIAGVFLIVSNTILDNIHEFFASRQMQNWRPIVLRLSLFCVTLSLRGSKRYLHSALFEKVSRAWLLDCRRVLGVSKTVGLKFLVIRYHDSVYSRFEWARIDLTLNEVVSFAHRRLDVTAGWSLIFLVVAEITHVGLLIVNITIITGETPVVFVNIGVPARSI